MAIFFLILLFAVAALFARSNALCHTGLLASHFSEDNYGQKTTQVAHRDALALKRPCTKPLASVRHGESDLNSNNH